jgi:hypothetical protein
LWGGHLYHNKSFSFYSCTYLKQKTDTKKNEVCFICGIPETVIEHLFENGITIENSKTEYLSKFSIDFSPYLFLPVKNYLIYYKVHKSLFESKFYRHKKLYLSKFTDPRSPPIFS